jgi:hypothetical protein
MQSTRRLRPPERIRFTESPVTFYRIGQFLRLSTDEVGVWVALSIHLGLLERVGGVLRVIPVPAHGLDPWTARIWLPEVQ